MSENRRKSSGRLFLRAFLRTLVLNPSFVLAPWVFLTVVVWLIIMKGDKSFTLDNLPLTIASVGVVVGSMIALILRFLSGPSTRLDLVEEIKRRDRLSNMLSSYRSAAVDSGLDEFKWKQLIDELKQDIQNSASVEFVTKIKEELSANQYRLVISEAGQKTLKRLYREVEALNRRGNLNLSLGVALAFVGVLLLAYMVLNHDQSTQQTVHTVGDFLTAFTPRLSIVLIIEVFSYFFLRLYKSSLTETKFFQNEATNMECLFLAMEVAISENDADLIKETVRTFSKVERNAMLVGKMTTKELEEAKLYERPLTFTPKHIAEFARALISQSKS